MELQNRPTRIVYRDDVGLIATDAIGRVHRLDDQLHVVASSPVAPPGRAIYAVTLVDDLVVTKDKYGTLAKWSLDTLQPLDVIDAHLLRDESDLMEGEEPSPTIHRGIAVWNGKVYFNNGYLQFTVVDLRTFAVERIVPALSEAHLEWFCTDRPGVHAVSDKSGQLFLGDLETVEFPVQVRLDKDANLHRIAYDPVHDRFWVTQDSGEGETASIANGVVTVRPDGTVDQSIMCAQDDLECLAFARDFSEAYVGGFDGRIDVIDNTSDELRISRSIGPFSHQVLDLAVAADGHVFALSQNGVIAKVDTRRGRAVHQGAYRPQCVWDLQPQPGDERRIYAATDDGVAVLRASDTAPHHNLSLVVEAHHRHGMGFTRRVLPFADGSYVGISRSRYVYRAGGDGEVVWRRRTPELLRTVSVSPDGNRLLVAATERAYELDAADGTEIDTLGIDNRPIWTTAYLPSGERVIGSRDGTLCAFGPGAGDHAERWRLDTDEYPKRMWVRDGDLFVSGEGGVKQVARDGSRYVQRWSDLLDNTCENGLAVGATMFAVTYGSQLGVYDLASSELRGLVEPLHDFCKALAAVTTDDGQTFVLVGGRGGFVACFWLDGDGNPWKVRDVFVPATDVGTATTEQPGFLAELAIPVGARG